MFSVAGGIRLDPLFSTAGGIRWDPLFSDAGGIRWDSLFSAFSRNRYKVNVRCIIFEVREVEHLIKIKPVRHTK